VRRKSDDRMKLGTNMIHSKRFRQHSSSLTTEHSFRVYYSLMKVGLIVPHKGLVRVPI